MRYSFLFLLFLSQLAYTQDFTEQWEGLFSFNRIVDIEQTADQIYAASENAVFVYDIASRSFTTITTVNGLSGDLISQIYYNEQNDQLVIGYEDGLLQIVEDDTVLDVVAIRDKQVINPDRKRINEFLANGDLLYIATDFGIAIYDLERLEFNDTYFIGANGAQLRVKSLEIFENFLYAATTDAGILRADITDPFLIDFMNWNQINTGSFDEVAATGSTLIAAGIDGSILQFSASTFQFTGGVFPSRVVDMTTSSGEFTVTGTSFLQIRSPDLSILTDVRDVNGEQLRFTAGNSNAQSIYIGTDSRGMVRLDRQNINPTEFIVADGPTRNRAFSVTASPNELWVGYGDYNGFYDPFPLDQFGISHLVEDTWTNYTPAEVNNINSIANITINPNNPDEVYLNSMHNGILQFVDGAAAIQYGVGNSSLSSILPPSTEFVRVSESTFDRQGNLWAIASQVSEMINRRDPTGNWSSVDVSDEFPELDGSQKESATKIVVSNSGNVFFGTIALGVYAYNPTNNRYGRLFNEIQNGNLINNNVSALTLDQNEQLWIGSDLGLRVLFNANSILSDNPPDARAIIIEDQNGVPRELLADQAVIDIEVDGSNRKWVATASAGAFLFSPSGQETIFQFTKNNSPLPSNTVNDIAIDNATGKIYFATDNGIVSFQGDRSSAPADDLEGVFAFPNPVKPGFDGNVTIDGLTDRARVKITDIEGNLVFELVSQGGSAQWDTRSFSGNRVASGVYMLLISTEDNIETKVSKIMVIR